ncbi:hypothetical protein QN277_025028 [Acacia crassicarpa]|uniref:Late embryogenesis abundant protein LEA-2 subgroup domain-containing protein n=1 Tax=Acacia crassicarpa TaxID=499986 RepID=A0AAE1MK60_9FABA|nr:hypothetical protein QN277_025028 [Acacia crassicarpa]
MKAESRKRRNLCLAVTAALVIALVLIVVILAFTVFKPKRPVDIVDSITIQEMHVGLNVAKLVVDLNITLGIEVSIKNPNHFGFKYSESNALLNYRGQLVGEAPIPAGEISASGTEKINVSLTIMANRLLSNSQLFSDYVAGSLPLSTSITISGKVSILGLIHVNAVSASSCDFALSVANKTVEHKVCRYKTKLN